MAPKEQPLIIDLREKEHKDGHNYFPVQDSYLRTCIASKISSYRKEFAEICDSLVELVGDPPSAKKVVGILVAVAGDSATMSNEALVVSNLCTRGAFLKLEMEDLQTLAAVSVSPTGSCYYILSLEQVKRYGIGAE